MAAALGPFAGCSDRERTSPIGIETLEPERFEVTLDEVFASPPLVDTYAETVINTGRSHTIYSGHFGAREMSSLLRFGGLPPAADTLKEVVLYLPVVGEAGDEAALTLGVHRLNENWNEDFTDATARPMFAGAPVATVKAAPGDTLLAVALPDSLVRTWIENDGDNNGIQLTPRGNTGTLRKFASREDSDRTGPFLRIVTQPQAGDAKIDTIFSGRDTYVTAPDTSLDLASAERLLIGRENGFTYRSAFEFQLPEIDGATSLNYASLELNLDPGAFELQDSLFSITAHQITSAVDTSAVIFLTRVERTVGLEAKSDSLSVVLTDLASDLRRSGQSTLKILLRSEIESADIDFISVVSSEGADADSLGPRLLLITSTSARQDTMRLRPAPPRGATR